LGLRQEYLCKAGGKHLEILMKKTLVTLIAACFLLNACISANTPAAENSVDWAGIYEGTLPGANSSIRVVLALNHDRTYSLTWQYIDKSSEIFTEKGSFAWNKTGDTITLDVEDWPPYYFVGQRHVIQLDMSGKKITGPLADQYILKQIK
jgi:uncharacterized lipoprotein NlpE involved in copper resistance